MAFTEPHSGSPILNGVQAVSGVFEPLFYTVSSPFFWGCRAVLSTTPAVPWTPTQCPGSGIAMLAYPPSLFVDRFGRSGVGRYPTGPGNSNLLPGTYRVARDRLSGCIGDFTGPVRFWPLVTTNGAPKGRIGVVAEGGRTDRFSQLPNDPFTSSWAKPTGCCVAPSSPARHLRRGDEPVHALNSPGLLAGTEKG